MKRIVFFATITACLVPALPAQAEQSLTLPSSLARAMPDEIAARTRIVDDPLEETVVFSTQRAGLREGPARGAQVDDGHLRAIIARETGQGSWQVWHDIAYARARKDVSHVHYLVDGAIRKVQPVVVEHWLDQCPATDQTGQCTQLTRIVFEIPEADIRKIAEGHEQGSREPWLMRLKDRNGESVTIGFAPGEVAGLLLAYDRWRSGVAATDHPSTQDAPPGG